MPLDSATEEIRRRADITEVVSQYVALVPAGSGRMKACCPFHDEKTPSFYVSRDKGFYKCFGCIEAGEPVWTTQGLKPIGAIRAGERVLDRNGDWREVFAIDWRKSAVLSLSTASFRREALQLTANHTCLWVRKADAVRAFPYLYNDKTRGIRFKGAYKSLYRAKNVVISQGEAREVEVGDFWLFPVAKTRDDSPLRAQNIIREWSSGKKTTRLEALPVSVAAARLYGRYLAEGSTNPRSVCFSFALDEAQTLALETRNLLCELFDLPSTLHLRPDRNTASVTCCKTDLARQLEHFFGTGAAHKRIPGEALQWPAEIQNALIEAYLQGDGNQKGSAKTVSRELAHGLFALGIGAGRNVSLSKNEVWTGKDKVPHREFWNFSCRAREGLAGFFEAIDGQKFYFSQVTSIEALEGEKIVVDLSVEGTSSFVTKNGLVHNCGASGDVFKFVQAMENTDFIGARKILGARYNVEIKPRREMTPEQKEEVSERDKLLKVTAAAAHFFREQFAGNLGLAARDYARQRGLSRETIEKFGIGYAPDNWDSLRAALTRKYGFSDDEGIAAGLFIEKKSLEGELGGMFAEGATRRVYDRYRHRLMFPIWDESGRVIAFGGRALEGGNTGNSDAKYINSPESPLFHKSNVLFGWHLARAEVSKREGVIITEGYMDAIALHEGGFAQTVATLGTALTAHHVALLRRLAPKVVYLCFDGDSAGMKAALRTAPLFAENELDVRVVRLPAQDDPDTFIRENGAVGMESALQEAIPLARYRLVSILNSHELNEVEGRAEAMRQAAEIINDLGSETERSGYVSFLVDELLKIERPQSRLEWERRRGEFERLVKNELRADEGRSGKKERLRDAKIGDGRLAPVREKRFVSPKWEAIRLEEEKAALDLHEATQSLGGAPNVASGVLKAEKCLIGALLGHAAWRGHILGQLPLAKWTHETHGEIVAAARKFEAGEEISPVEFTENLSEEAQKVVGEVMLSDEAASLPDAEVINDWIARVEWHWARQREIEMSELIKGKIERGEAVSEAERAAFAAALEATRRKMPVPEK